MSIKPSIKLVREEIERFLIGTEPEVLCISGKWGVGKTYGWNYYLSEAKKIGGIGLKRYAYVSLFGLKTLNELRYALYEATLPVEKLGTESPWEELNLKNLPKTFPRNPLRWIISKLNKLPLVQGYSGLTESVLFYFVGKQLICIDDLERSGSGLDVIDVFGLISFLKEQRGCRIVLLLNKEEIEPKQREVFEKQFEKVVDTHLHFEPTPEEAADIVFPNPEGIRKDMRQLCTTLGILNIRVIKKVEKICLRLEEVLKEKYPGVVYQAIHSATLFAWSKYQKDNVPPPFDFLKDISYLHGLSSAKDQMTENDKRWKDLMKEYKFQSADEFDSTIHDIIESGVFDDDALLAAAEKQSQGIAKSQQEKAMSDAWDLYHDSFDDNESEVMDRILTVSLQNLKVISPMNLDATVRILKEFNRESQASDLLAKYIEARSEEKDLFNLERSAFGSEVKDTDVLKAFADKLNSFVDQRNPSDVLEDMVRNRGWNPEDVELIDKLDADDFYRLFKNEKGDRLHVVVRAALRLQSKDTARSQEHGSISERAIKALEKIARESPLNAKRVATQGVKIPEAESGTATP